MGLSIITIIVVLFSLFLSILVVYERYVQVLSKLYKQMITIFTHSR